MFSKSRKKFTKYVFESLSNDTKRFYQKRERINKSIAEKKQEMEEWSAKRKLNRNR
jgi:hypothetical protein